VPTVAAPGTSPADQELSEYETELRLNSSERELPVTFSALADLSGAALRRADGHVIAGDGARWSELSLLGASTYANGEPVLRARARERMEEAAVDSRSARSNPGGGVPGDGVHVISLASCEPAEPASDRPSHARARRGRAG
jgi:hypothetical protein